MNFELISPKKYFLLFNLSVISAISYVSADFSGFLIERKLVSEAPEVAGKKRVERRVPRTRPNLGFFSVISGRNIFNDKPQGAKEKEVEGDPGSQAGGVETVEVKDEVETLSSLNMILVGTSVKGGRGYIAILEDRATKVQKGYRIGDEILPDITVSNITRKSVTVLRGGKPEIIYYPEIGKAAAGRSPKKRSRGKAVGTRRDSRVTNITDTRKILDRRYVDNELKDMGRLLTQIRAVPVAKKGFKVFNIVKGSIFEKIGLKNGDMLKRINGLDMSSPDKAMEMYMQLKGATSLQLDIQRDGSLLSYDYTIR